MVLAHMVLIQFDVKATSFDSSFFIFTKVIGVK